MCENDPYRVTAFATSGSRLAASGWDPNRPWRLVRRAYQVEGLSQSLTGPGRVDDQIRAEPGAEPCDKLHGTHRHVTSST